MIEAAFIAYRLVAYRFVRVPVSVDFDFMFFF